MLPLPASSGPGRGAPTSKRACKTSIHVACRYVPDTSLVCISVVCIDVGTRPVAQKWPTTPIVLRKLRRACYTHIHQLMQCTFNVHVAVACKLGGCGTGPTSKRACKARRNRYVPGTSSFMSRGGVSRYAWYAQKRPTTSRPHVLRMPWSSRELQRAVPASCN